MIAPAPSTWEDAIRANNDILDLYESKSIEFIRDVIAKNPGLKPTVSYSGGKDSLVTLLITSKAVGRLPIIFANTGLEFSETIENVRIVQEKYGLELIERSGAEGFWEGFEGK